MAGSITDQIILDIIQVEGDKYTNDPSDAGGPTKYGITLKTLSTYRGKQCTAEDVKNLTKDEAFAIYRKLYILQPRFDLIEQINARIAAEVIDTGVNMGQSTAAKFLQRALNALNYSGSYPMLVVDGAVGPATVAALKGFLNQRGTQGEAVLLLALNGLQATRYIELTEAKESQRKYLYGWLDHRVTAQVQKYMKEKA